LEGLNGRLPALVLQAVIIISSVVGATVWITDTIHEVDQKIGVVKDSVVALRASVDTRISAVEGQVEDRWTSTHMRLWSQRIKESNPDLRVPWVDDVIRDCERNH
jgi:hypothetical protein